MMNFTVDEEKCTGCGSCAADCPSLLLRMKNNRPCVVPGGEKYCIKCQHCFSVCPAGAISIFGKKPEESEPFGLLAETERLKNLIRYRRSVRRFQPGDLGRDEIRELLEVLKFSPTGCNDHKTVFCVVSGRAKMEELRSKLSERILAALKNDTLPPSLGLFRTMELPLRRNIDVLFRGAPHLVIAASPASAPCPAQDAVIALSQFELVAQSMGIGTTWCGLALMALHLAPELAPEFGIPEGCNAGFAMLFGKSAVRYARLPQPENADIRFV